MEIPVGSTNGVKHKVYWRGEAIEPDTLPTVQVFDVTDDPTADPPINPNYVIYTLTAEKDETDIGVYTVYLPIHATSKSKELKLKWIYTINGAEQEKEHKLFVITPYVDFAEACGCLEIGNDPSDPNYKSYKEILAAERYARKSIESFTGQKFYLYSDVYSVYGTDSDTLGLPAKINSIHKLYMNDQLLVDNIQGVDNWNYVIDFTESGFGIRVNRASLVDNTVYTANGMIPPSIHGGSGIFQDGVRYTVDGQYGWSYVPDEVSLAAIELMKDYFAKDHIWRNKYIDKISTFDWDFEYGSGATSGTGNLYADQLLSDFVVSKVLLF